MIELDAASNRGIDDIREIRERVAVQPALGRRKIYILDEAHSLTTDASNALLKTLEEPPEHVVFVLCTTEPHKLLDTIKGRCQAFAFARPSVEEIRVVLRRIAAAEGIEADEDALGLIARSARGSFRDAVSQLDQLATACGGVVSADRRPRAARHRRGARAARHRRRRRGAQRARRAARRRRARRPPARTSASWSTDLLGHLRLLLLTRELGEVPASAPLADEARAALAEQAGRVDERARRDARCRACSAVLDELRDGGDPRLPLELELVRAVAAVDRPLDRGHPAPRSTRSRSGGARADPAARARAASAPPPSAAAPVDAAARRRAAAACASRCAAGRSHRWPVRRPSEMPPWDVAPEPAARRRSRPP